MQSETPRQATDARAAARTDEVDRLSAGWRAALDAADASFDSAGAILPAEALRGRAADLAGERTSAALALESLARDRLSHGWLSDLQVATGKVRHLLAIPDDSLACVFDSEGVLERSAAVHAAAWSETFDELLTRRSERTGGRFAQFDLHRDYSGLIDGKLRLDGVRAFLASRGIRIPEGNPRDLAGSETVNGLANRKREVLERLLRERHMDAYDGSRRYLRLARAAGLGIGVVSASASGGLILTRSGMADLVDQVVDGNVMLAEHLRSKPEPDVLVAAAVRLGIPPGRSVAFETTAGGVIAARSADFGLVVGVGDPGTHEALRRAGADVTASSLRELLEQRLAAFR